MRQKISALLVALVLTISANAQQQVKSFDAFCYIFNNNYAFFDLHKVNWKASYQKYRPLVSDDITNDSLFNIMSAMVKPLGDSHVNIIDAKRKKKFNAAGYSKFAAEFNTDSLKAAFWANNDRLLLANGFAPVKGYGSVFKGRHLFYYSRSANYAYLRITRCFAKITDGEIDDKDFEMQVLDSLMAQSKGLRGIIIDVRANIGGDDEFSYEVAGRFTVKPVTGHFKQERIAKTNKYSKLQKWIIQPRGSYAFTKPVMLLTNSKTVSAAEVLTLAMKQLPQVKTIGEPTEGNLSDMFSEDLPNGWSVTLSNQKYYSPKMVCYEGVGVPVYVRVSNSLQELETGHDAVLSTALNRMDAAAK
ncbi:S41 family peptidase [Mucilaginibacter pallidiroseus]|uniref:S41 family peptidase n=1 Tax=Mucilaginibacter pallidiroseus TaxID=2599295 RepID=A0A563UF77_9SPHI|nr:S41 family peptidase [Mucilaginibacter pallidiroseus]TWR30008.1 S41 family peptidase [Mucilaginibacter pallidiroseus]